MAKKTETSDEQHNVLWSILLAALFMLTLACARYCIQPHPNLDKVLPSVIFNDAGDR